MTTLAVADADAPRGNLVLQHPLFLKAAAGVVLLIVWEIIVRSFAPSYVAKPSGVASVFFSVLGNPQFISSAGATLRAVAVGLVISMVAGTIIGVPMGRIKLVEHGLRYYVNSLFATPMVAIMPLLTLWFGYSVDARLAAIVFAGFFSVAVNASEGARNVPLESMEVARSFRARPISTLFDVILPSSLPYLIAGLRLAAGRALVAAVVAEFFISITGLGYFILFNSRTFKHNEAFVAVLVLAAAGVGFEVFTRWVTRRYFPWHRAR